MTWGTREEVQAEHGLSAYKFKVLLRVGRIERKTAADGSPVYRVADVGPTSWLGMVEARERHGLRLSSGEWARLARDGEWQVRYVCDQVFVRPVLASERDRGLITGRRDASVGGGR